MTDLGREAWIVAYRRTPFGRYGGSLSSVRADDLATVPMRAVVEGIPLETIDDVILGATNQAGEDNRNVARMAALLAGFPDTVPGVTVNRLCGSGLEAVVQAARAIGQGDADLVVAGGVESMSRAPFVVAKADQPFPTGAEMASTTLGWRLVNPAMRALGHTDPMGVTAENVAATFSISRADQDQFAARSHHRAAAAMARGRFDAEIAAVDIPNRDGSTSVRVDEHPRPNTSVDSLARLRASFVEGGTVTAGNSSGINDGAAAVLVASRDTADRFGLTKMARIAGASVVGVPPRLMGIGPIAATERLLQRAGLTVDDIDIVELNEAFASQALACMRALGLPDDAPHVNPNGGAIALGHPTGASGARLAGTAALELVERGAHRAIATMCIGVGQGISVLLERP
jgi:3-oxoadipyl-CoA thiolase